MRLKQFQDVLLEGGKAIKRSQPVHQAEANYLGDELIKKLNALGIKAAMVGSAGKRPDGAMSGDIDIAIELTNIEKVRELALSLAAEKAYHPMPGLGVYSFGYQHPAGIAQVDLMPTSNLNYAQWAYYNDKSDLALGLKGAHRNEVLFSIAKHAQTEHYEHDDEGMPLMRKRLGLNLNDGLYSMIQSCKGKTKRLKDFSTLNKSLIANDPDQVAQLLCGPLATAKNTLTFDQVLGHVKSSCFPYKQQLPDIIKSTVQGLERKGLYVPTSLQL